MFMDPKLIPNFPISEDAIEVGNKLQKLFKKKELTHMSLDMNGFVQCY